MEYIDRTFIFSTMRVFSAFLVLFGATMSGLLAQKLQLQFPDIPSATVSELSISLNNQYLLSDRTRLWEIRSGRLLHNRTEGLNNHYFDSLVNTIGFHRWDEENKYEIGFLGESSSLIDTQTGEPLLQFRGELLDISDYFLACSGRSRYGMGVSIKRLGDGSDSLFIPTHSFTGAISKDNSLIALSPWEEGRPIEIWDISSGKLMISLGQRRLLLDRFAVLKGDGIVNFEGNISHQLNGQDQYLGTFGFTSEITTQMNVVMDIYNSAIKNEYPGRLLFAKDNLLVTGIDHEDEIIPMSDYELMDHEIFVFDLAKDDLLGVYKLPQDYQSSTIEFSAVCGNNNVLVVSNWSSMLLWDLENKELIQEFAFENSILDRDIFISPAGTFIFIDRNVEGGYELYNTITRKSLKLTDFHAGSIDAVHFSDEETRIQVTYSSGKKMAWDLPEGTQSANSRGNQFNLEKEVDFNSNSIELNNIRIQIGSKGDLIIHDKTSDELIAQGFLLGNKNSIMVTDNGYYKATKEASKKLYYVQGLKTIGFEQLDLKFNRPDLVLKATGSNDSRLIESYKKAYSKRISRLGLDTTNFNSSYNVPEASVTNRKEIEYINTKGKAVLTLLFSDQSSLLDRYNVFINETPAFGKTGVSIRARELHSFDTTLTIDLSKGENRISASVINDQGIESYREPLFVRYEDLNQVTESVYFLGIGINNFKESGHDLNFSVKDIRDLAVRFSEKYGANIRTDTLFNQDVTREKIIALKEKLRNTRVDDKVIIAYSGHGLISEDLDYYLSTYEVDFNNPEIKGLPYESLEDLLDSIPARKKLMLLDACHSGEIDKEDQKKINKLVASNAGVKDGLSKGIEGSTTTTAKLGTQNTFELMQELFVNVKNETGATIISAAGGTQFAYETGEFANGVFTYSILNFMDQNETFTVQELKRHVSEEVQRLTDGLQKPTSRAETTNVDWRVW